MVIHVFQLPRRLRIAREALGLTQRQAARLAGVDSTWLSHLERARRVGPTESAIRQFGIGLGANEKTLAELVRAAKHDRVLRVVHAETPEVCSVVASVLVAGTVLDVSELTGLARSVDRLTNLKQELAQLSSSPAHLEDASGLNSPSGRPTESLSTANHV